MGPFFVTLSWPRTPHIRASVPSPPITSLSWTCETSSRKVPNLLVSLACLIWHLPGTPTPLGRQSLQSTTGLLLLPLMLSVVGILVKHRSLPALASSANISPLLWPARRQTFRLTLVCPRSLHRGVLVLAPPRRHYPLARRVPLRLVLYLMFPPACRGKLIPLLRQPVPPPQDRRHPPLLGPPH